MVEGEASQPAGQPSFLAGLVMAVRRQGQDGVGDHGPSARAA